MKSADLIFGLKHLGLFVPNLNEAVSFYHDLFGFETRSVNPDADGNPHIVFMDKCGLELELIQMDEDKKQNWIDAANVTPNHFALCCSDTAKFVELLKEKGETFETEKDQRVSNFDQPPRDIDIVFFHGLGGERIEVFQEITAE